MGACQNCGHQCCGNSCDFVDCSVCDKGYYLCGDENCGCASSMLYRKCDKCKKTAVLCEYCHFCSVCDGIMGDRIGNLQCVLDDVLYEVNYGENDPENIQKLGLEMADVVHEIVKNEIDINKISFESEEDTPMNRAIESGFVEGIKILLKNGVKMTEDDICFLAKYPGLCEKVIEVFSASDLDWLLRASISQPNIATAKVILTNHESRSKIPIDTLTERYSRIADNYGSEENKKDRYEIGKILIKAGADFTKYNLPKELIPTAIQMSQKKDSVKKPIFILKDNKYNGN